jgi:hypothetical protein
MLGLQSPDHLPREGQRDLRVLRQQRLEVLLAELHQHGVAHRHHGRRARLAGEQAHFADDFAARQFAHHARRRAVFGNVDAHAAADAEEG